MALSVSQGALIITFAATLCFVIANETWDVKFDTCILPSYPKNGFYEIRDESFLTPSPINSNQSNLRSRVRLEYSCRRGYKLKGPTTTSCFTGFWTHANQPQCLSQCVLDKNPSVNYLCFSNKSTSQEDAYLCDELVDEETTVRPQCRSPFYYHTGELADMQCKAGTWSYVATCTPDCGVVTYNREFAKQPVNQGTTPWHVGVYFKIKDPYLQICGGSIITSEVVISAAHCFWGEVKRQRPASHFAVTAGKFYRHWNSQLDFSAQKSDVQEIRLPARFTGLQTNYQDDIAALKVVTPFQFGTFVKPVCINFDFDFDRSQLTVGLRLQLFSKDSVVKDLKASMIRDMQIASWGRSAQDGLEDHWQFLQEVDLPFVSDEQCLMESPAGSREYITADKFCAYYNGTARELCQGDTGGGLAFPAWSRGEERYFLRGVASAARGDKQYCVMFTTFTHVLKHAQFIKEYYTPNKDKCILPPFPDNGCYTTNTLNAKPGEAYDTVNISISCQQGYAVNGPSSVYCYNGQWSDLMPKCVSLCHLSQHYSVEYLCLLPGEELRACNEYELTGTVVRPRCRSPEYFSPAALDDMRCIDGNWTYVARCSPECAIYTPADTNFNLNKQNVARGEMPWHGGVYEKMLLQLRHICGATLIRSSILLSAALCFWNRTGANHTISGTKFAVGVGKLYRPWSAPEDDGYAQQSDVRELHLPAGYVRDDIAVVIVSVPFNYTAYVRPVCLHFGATFMRKQLQPGVIGKIAGWSRIAEDGASNFLELKYLNMPYVNLETCKAESSKYFLKRITSDKICGGYRSATSPVSSLCRGETGGGWVFPVQHGEKQRFFLRGVMTIVDITAFGNHPCTVYGYVVFTAIQSNEQFIKPFLHEERYIDIPPPSYVSDRTLHT